MNQMPGLSAPGADKDTASIFQVRNRLLGGHDFCPGMIFYIDVHFRSIAGLALSVKRAIDFSPNLVLNAR
jgi:hypothetical protein